MENVSKISADFESQISGAISIGATSFTLQSVKDKEGNDLSDGVYTFTIDRDNTSRKEYLIGQLTSATKTVSSISSVSSQGVLTANAQKAHRIGANVIISDHSILAALSRIFNGVGTINPASPLAYASNPTLSSAGQLATKGYVDSVVTGGSVNTDRIILGGQTAGETIVIGDIVYFKSSDSRWWKASATDTTTFSNVLIGVALGAGTAGNPVTDGVQIYGICDVFTGLTATATYYLSNTAGEIATSVGSNPVSIGQAFNTTGLFLNPNTMLGAITSNDITQSAKGGTLGEQTTSTNTLEFGRANATGQRNRLAQRFVPTKTKMRGIELWKKANTGTYTGNVTITLQADNAGVPSGTALATRVITSAVYNALADNSAFENLFASEYTTLVVGNPYWIVTESSTADNSNHGNLGGRTSGGTGGVFRWNVTDGWVAIANSDLYYKVMEGNTNQLVRTGTGGHLQGLNKSNLQVFTSSGTWTKPDGLSYIIVEVIGGGGGGQSSTTNSASVGRTGGGGGYSKKLITNANLGATETVTVGAGGAGGTSSNANGVDGGTSSFGSHCSATGGKADGLAYNPASGGVGSGGDINSKGGQGMFGSSDAGTSVSNTPNKGGDTVLGFGGEKAQQSNSSSVWTGNQGVLGGGGSGGVTVGSSGRGNGGAGGDGIVIVTEFY
jgi:hypothetical protein